MSSYPIVLRVLFQIMHSGMHPIDPNALLAAQMGQMHIGPGAGNNVGHPQLIDDRAGMM